MRACKILNSTRAKYIKAKRVMYMARTIKDIMVQGRTTEEIRALVQNWFAQNQTASIENKPEYILGYWGMAFASNPKYIQVSFRPSQDGVIVHTEGWMSGMLGDMDFSPSAVAGGIGRRQGWQGMARLWETLQAFSKAPSSVLQTTPTVNAPPPPPPPPPQPSCPTCGQPLTFIQQYNRWYCYRERKYA